MARFSQQQRPLIRPMIQTAGRSFCFFHDGMVGSGWRLARLLIALLLLGFASQSMATALSATVDRAAIGVNESLNLTLRYEGQALGDPDFSRLEQDFEIIANQRQSQFSFGGGQGQSYTLWQLALVPRRGGSLVIPSFNFKGEISDAIPIEVSDSPSPSADSQSVFVETELQNSQVYVQEQALLTLRLYTAIPLTSLSASELEVPGARVVQVHENQYQKTLNGTAYTVVELRYALFADNPGDLSIPALRFSGTIADSRDPFSSFGGSFFGRGGKRIAVDSRAKTLRVKPRPQGIAADQWLPSAGLSLAQRWSATPEEFVVGEPVTRSVIISAQGLQGAQLPSLNMASGDGFKLYPDQPKVEDSTSATGILGSRIESVAVVPTHPGQLTLPAISVQWWDTVAGEWRETRLESQTVTVMEAQNIASGRTQTGQNTRQGLGDTMIESQQRESASLWRWILIGSNTVFALLAAIFALLWWQRGVDQQHAPKSDDNTNQDTERTAFERVRRLPSEQLATLRQAIIHWAQIYWENPQLKTLADVVNVSGSSDLAPHFAALDKQLYSADGGTDHVDTNAIREILVSLRQSNKNKGEVNYASLPPLYPGQ